MKVCKLQRDSLDSNSKRLTSLEGINALPQKLRIAFVLALYRLRAEMKKNHIPVDGND